MIRAHFGLEKPPFSSESVELLPHQQYVLDTLRVHCQQGGLCLIVGEPGTGKSVIKQALCSHDPKRLLAPVVNRTLHTYHSVLRILCQAFHIETHGRDFKCEKRLIEEAHKQNKSGKMLAPIIDDAHLMKTDALRRLRLVFEDFPKNHNLVLLGQSQLLYTLSLTVNEDIRSRVTCSAKLPKLAPRTCAPGSYASSTASLSPRAFSPRRPSTSSSAPVSGILRRTRNLCVSGLLEAVRDRVRVVDLKQVNRVLLQPHWRQQQDIPDLPQRRTDEARLRFRESGLILPTSS